MLRPLLAMLAAGLATFNSLYATQAILPVLADYFLLTSSQASWTVSAATGSLALAIVPASVLSEQFGRGRVIIVSAVCSTVVGLLLPWAPSAWWLIIGRGIQGVFLAGVPAVAMTWLSEELSARQLSRAMGVYVAGTSIGGLSGRLIPSGILELFTMNPSWVSSVAPWRVAMAASAAFAFVCALLIAMILPPQKNFHPKRLTLGGEFRAMASHWANRQLALLFFLGFVLMGSFVSMYNFIGFRLTQEFGLSEGVVGAIFLLYLAGTFTSARAGRWPPARALLLSSVAYVLSTVVIQSHHLALVVAGLLGFTAAFFAAHAIASSWVGKLATHDRAEASSTYLLCYYAGSSLLGWSHWSTWLVVVSVVIAAALFPGLSRLASVE